MRFFLRWSFVIVFFSSLTAVMAQYEATPRQFHSNPWLLDWIPATCCVTNDCCWEISASEVEPLPNDQWKIKSTGQIIHRKDWSPDGKYYRCACEHDPDARKWIRHQGAKTRCLFVPQQFVMKF